MTKTEIEDYFNSNKKPATTYPHSVVVDHDAVDTGPAQYATMEAAPVPVFRQATPPPVLPAGREPAATPVEYTAPMNADQRVLEKLSALNGGLTPAIDPTVRVSDQIVNGLYPQAFAQSPQVKPPMADYPMGPTIEINRGAGQEPDPAFRPPQVSLADVLRDTAGSPVLSGNGNPIGLPNQSTGNVAGGKGGAGGK